MSVVMALARAFTFAGPAYADPKSGGKHYSDTQDKHPCTILVIPSASDATFFTSR